MRASPWLGGWLSLALLAQPGDAWACGGCFTAATIDGRKNVQVVTDHRMVLALAAEQTTLWDQIRYAGAPEDFVWVLPIPRGVPVRMGLGDNAFVDALANASAPQIRASFTVLCNRAGFATARPDFSSSWGRGGGGGCGGSSASIDYTPGAASGADGGSTQTPYTGSEDLSLVGTRDVVGPYAAEVLAGGAGSFQRWAQANAYDIPGPTLSAVRWYEGLGTDFLVLRLAPEAGVEQMQPVRITFPGYVPTLPLRMIAAGVADKVGLDLMVIASAAMQVERFANAQVDRTRLVWDAAASRSNYRAEFNRTLTRYAGRAWITESMVALTAPMMGPVTPGLEAVGLDAGLIEQLAGWSDAGAPFFDFDRILRPGVLPSEAFRVDPYVDRRIVFQHLGARATLTRLRTELDLRALDDDLTLGPAPLGHWVTREIPITSATNLPACPAASGSTRPSPPWTPPRRPVGPALLTFCLAALAVRRLRRARGAMLQAPQLAGAA